LVSLSLSLSLSLSIYIYICLWCIHPNAASNLKIAASLKLPLRPDASKPVVQEAIHAVEELYFFRRFDESINLVDKLLAERPDGKSPFDSESTRILQRYRSNCESKKSLKQTA
jgi:hypothetical protein